MPGRKSNESYTGSDAGRILFTHACRTQAGKSVPLQGNTRVVFCHVCVEPEAPAQRAADPGAETVPKDGKLSDLCLPPGMGAAGTGAAGNLAIFVRRGL